MSKHVFCLGLTAEDELIINRTVLALNDAKKPDVVFFGSNEPIQNASLLAALKALYHDDTLAIHTRGLDDGLNVPLAIKGLAVRALSRSPFKTADEASEVFSKPAQNAAGWIWRTMHCLGIADVVLTVDDSKAAKSQEIAAYLTAARAIGVPVVGLHSGLSIEQFSTFTQDLFTATVNVGTPACNDVLASLLSTL
jgi:hypothetical protein